MWKHLTSNDIKKVLSQDEIDNLKNLSIDEDISDVV